MPMEILQKCNTLNSPHLRSYRFHITTKIFCISCYCVSLTIAFTVLQSILVLFSLFIESLMAHTCRFAVKTVDDKFFLKGVSSCFPLSLPSITCLLQDTTGRFMNIRPVSTNLWFILSISLTIIEQTEYRTDQNFHHYLHRFIINYSWKYYERLASPFVFIWNDLFFKHFQIALS